MYTFLGAIGFFFLRKIDVIFTVAVCTTASPVWVRKGSHTYQRGGVWIISFLTHRNTRWKNREQQKYQKTHLNEDTFSTAADWPQLVKNRSLFLGIQALKIKFCPLELKCMCCSLLSQSKSLRISRPGHSRQHAMLLNASHRFWNIYYRYYG